MQFPELVLVEFTEAGELVGTRTESPEWSPTTEPLDDEVTAGLRSWEGELGFEPGTIQVRPFFIESRWIGIRDLPEHYQDVVDDPAQFPEDRRQELQGDIRDWLARGDFVLYWDEDYYLDRDGEVVSS